MTNPKTEPVCKFDEGCHRVVPCDPGCGAPWISAEEAGPEDVLVDAVALLREAATLYDAREQPKSAAQLRAMARSLDAGSLPPVSVPPPATRADVLREAADHLTREGRAREDATWSDREAELARGWQDAAHELRRLADEATPVAVPSPLANEPGPAVAAPRADDQAALRDRIRRALCEASGNGFMWGTDMLEPDEYGDVADAVLAVLPEPTDRAAALREAADAVFALDYDVMVGEEGDENLGSMREAWDLGTIHAEKLLRRLADEAAVVPPPALTEEGRLRAQVEVLQQDAERDRGLAKVGARCMRDGHQGLIEQGRLVLEGWRFALSTALGLGTGAPWEAIHERVKELTAAVDTSEDRCAECGHFRGAHEEAEEPVSVGRCTVCADEDERHDFEAVEESRRLAAVSGPVAGEQQAECNCGGPATSTTLPSGTTYEEHKRTCAVMAAEVPTTTKPETAADRDTLRRQFGDVLRRWGLLDEQIDQKAAEEYAVTDLLALLPEQTSRDAETEHLRDRLTSCRERVGIAADKAIAAEETIERARQARRRLTSALIAVEPLLTTPYPDDPRWSPWTRFVGPALKELSDALRTGPAANVEPAAGVRQDGAQPS